MKRIISAVLIGIAAGGAISAQKFAVKPHAEIDLISGFGFGSSIEMSAKTGSNEFGADFGYTFLNKAGNRLEVNIGLGYRYLNTTFTAGSFGYDYAAPADADEDGNPYIRFCDVGNLSQKINSGYLTLPVYLQYAYRCTDWLEVQALAGVKLGFNTGAKVNSTSGTVYSYGVFPEYDNLMIDAPYLDDFGEVNLAGREGGRPAANGMTALAMVGAGLSGRIYGPLWFDLGVRYNIGLNDVFEKGIESDGKFTEATAPVTYSVADGTTVKPLSDYLTKGKLSPLSLNIGLTVRF